MSALADIRPGEVLIRLDDGNPGRRSSAVVAHLTDSGRIVLRDDEGQVDDSHIAEQFTPKGKLIGGADTLRRPTEAELARHRYEAARDHASIMEGAALDAAAALDTLRGRLEVMQREAMDLLDQAERLESAA